MKWVTRARPKVDRVACPWLIKRFVDRQAEFLYVPTDQVMEVAQREGATPYDVKGVEFGHHGKECSFDALVKKHGLDRDPALVLLAKIGRQVEQHRRFFAGLAMNKFQIAVADGPASIDAPVQRLVRSSLVLPREKRQQVDAV